MSAPQLYCTFQLADLFLGVSVLNVQEVIKFQPMTFVPLAPHMVSGLMNLRGQIVTAIDLRRRLEFADRPNGETPMNVVIRTDEGPVSLLVDEIGDVLEVSEKSYEAPPSTMKGIARDLITGVHTLEDRLLLILDIAKVVSVPQFKEA